MKYTLPFDPPLLPDFCEFVVYDGFLPHETDRIGNLLEKEIAQKATVSGRDKYNEELRKSSVIFLEPSEKIQWIYEPITSLAANCNAQRYRFDLNGFLQPLQYAKYEDGNFSNGTWIFTRARFRTESSV